VKKTVQNNRLFLFMGGSLRFIQNNGSFIVVMAVPVWGNIFRQKIRWPVFRWGFVQPRISGHSLVASKQLTGRVGAREAFFEVVFFLDFENKALHLKGVKDPIRVHFSHDF